MSTQCRIAVRQSNGSFLAVVSHYDGYPSRMVPILMKRYDTDEKRAALMVNHIDFFDNHNDDRPVFISESDRGYEEKAVEIHASISFVLEAKGLLGVAHTYIYDDKWYGWYPYLEMVPIDLRYYELFLINTSEEDCSW